MSILTDAWGFKPTAGRVVLMVGAMLVALIVFAALAVLVQPSSDVVTIGMAVAYLLCGLAIVSWLRNRFFIEDFDARTELTSESTGEIDR